jgi:hypothetical protein
MKYTINAFSLSNTNSNNEIRIHFRGAFFYITARGQKGIIFPWNTQTLDLLKSDLPLSFYGFSGRQEVNHSNINHDVLLWHAGKLWKVIKRTEAVPVPTEDVRKIVENDIQSMNTEINVKLATINTKPYTLKVTTPDLKIKYITIPFFQ